MAKKSCVAILLSSTFLISFSHAQTCVTPPPDLVSWWPGDGTTDDIADGNDGVLQGTATYGAGIVDLAFSIPAATDHVSVADAGSLNITGDLTLEAWVNLADVASFGTPGQDRLMFYKGNSSGSVRTYSFWVEGETGTPGMARLRYALSQTNFAASSNLTWTDGTWYHLAAVKSGSSITFYRNGLVAGSGAVSGSPSATPGEALILGGSGVNGLRGLLDEPTLYGRALSSSEIMAIFQAGGEGKCKPVAVPAMTSTHVGWSALIVALGAFFLLRLRRPQRSTGPLAST